MRIMIRNYETGNSICLECRAVYFDNSRNGLVIESSSGTYFSDNATQNDSALILSRLLEYGFCNVSESLRFKDITEDIRLKNLEDAYDFYM